MTHKQLTQRMIASGLVFLLAFPVTAAAQAPVPAASTAQAAAPMIQSLRVLPLAGNNAVNDLERQVMAPIAVQVLDVNDQPVAGASVIFRFPINGPSANFANQQTTQTVQTGANGQARATGWTANNQVGSFAVQVTASRGSEQGLGIINMTNVPRIIPASELPKKNPWTSKWAKIAYIAAGAGIAAAIATRGGNANTGTTTIQGGPGVPAIGGPQ